MPRMPVVSLSVVLCTFLLASSASGQESSGIAGVVRDTSGAVLPGVTVEASEPGPDRADEDGNNRRRRSLQYRRPASGTYVVTFTFPASARSRMRASTSPPASRLPSTPTCASAPSKKPSPSAGRRRSSTPRTSASRSSPRARSSTRCRPARNPFTPWWRWPPALPASNDVGGRYFAEAGAYHGKRGTKAYFDGMGIENSAGNSSYQINAAVVEEMVLQTSGISAEVNADGPVMNIVPKEGGNTFKAILSGNYSGKGMESTNLTQKLKDRGLQTANKTIKIFDEAASVGGPIMQNKLWFFAAGRTWGMARQFAGVYWNQTQNVVLSPPGADLEVVKLTPWVDRPLDVHSGRWEWYDTYLGRLTWQAGSKHKFNILNDNQKACNCGSTVATTLQEVGGGYRFEPNRFIQGTYNSPITQAAARGRCRRVHFTVECLLAAGRASQDRRHHGYRHRVSATARPAPTADIRITPTATWCAALLTYVTGSHTFKAGFQREHLKTDNFFLANGNVQYTFRSGVPQSILQRTTPYLELDRTDDLGIFAQDQWRFRRFTFNYGLRFDYVNGYTPDQDIPGQPDEKYYDRFPGVPTLNAWVGERKYAAVNGIPNWKDLNPRVGVAYDVFGNGRTAIKTSLGRYVAKTNVDVAVLLNPITTAVNTASRSWTDLNGNYLPRLRPGKLCRQRGPAGGRCAARQSQFRQVQPVGGSLDGRCTGRLGRAGLQLGCTPPKRSTS